MITELVKLNEPLTKELVDFYIAKYNNIMHISSFVKLSSTYQLGVIIEFLNSKNVSYVCDLHNVYIFYVDPRLNANNIIKHYNEKGQLTDIIKSFNKDTEFKSILEANVWTIEYIFKETLKPF